MSISNLLVSNNLNLRCNSMTTKEVIVSQPNITNPLQLATKAYVDAGSANVGDLQTVLQAGHDARGESIVGLNNLTTATINTTGNVSVGGILSVTDINGDIDIDGTVKCDQINLIKAKQI